MSISENFSPLASRYAIASFYESNVHPILGTVVSSFPRLVQVGLCGYVLERRLLTTYGGGLIRLLIRFLR
jgi:hypothetical protein